jgi:hypothetical protein
MAASSLASVDLPDPEVPTTDTRRTIAERNTARRRDAIHFPVASASRGVRFYDVRFYGARFHGVAPKVPHPMARPFHGARQTRAERGR